MTPPTTLHIIGVIDTLTECLAEIHAQEIEAEHYGDNPEDCSYCRAIREARECLEQLRALV